MWPKVPNKSTRAFVGVPTCFLVFLKGLWSTVWKWNFLVNEKSFFCWWASFWNFFNRKALVFSHSFASCRVNFNENLWVWYPFNFFQKLKEVSLSFLQLENRKSSLKKFFPFFFSSGDWDHHLHFLKTSILPSSNVPNRSPLIPLRSGKTRVTKRELKRKWKRHHKHYEKIWCITSFAIQKWWGGTDFFFTLT